jgi:putative FmdB family regulatory protein
MPVFEYICEKCQHEFEALVGTADKPECPSCRNSELKKKFSTFATVVKNEAFAACDSCAASEHGGCGHNPAMGGCPGGACGL